jgi:hypothetical protein
MRVTKDTLPDGAKSVATNAADRAACRVQGSRAAYRLRAYPRPVRALQVPLLATAKPGGVGLIYPRLSSDGLGNAIAISYDQIRRT